MLSKIHVLISQVNHKIKGSRLSLTAYLYAHKTIEDCTGAEEAGIELASKVDRISYTRKTRWEMPHQLWLIKTLPQLSQTLCSSPSGDNRRFLDASEHPISRPSHLVGQQTSAKQGFIV